MFAKTYGENATMHSVLNYSLLSLYLLSSPKSIGTLDTCVKTFVLRVRFYFIFFFILFFAFWSTLFHPYFSSEYNIEVPIGGTILDIPVNGLHYANVCWGKALECAY